MRSIPNFTRSLCLIASVWLLSLHASLQAAKPFLSTTLTPFDLTQQLDGNTLTSTSNLVTLKVLTSAQLASNLHLSGNLIINGQGNIAGVLYPTTVGQAGQMLGLDSSGRAVWLNPPSSGFSGNYADLSGKPALFSGNYADLVGKPTLPTLGSNIALSDVALVLTANWDNTAHPWSDSEIADNLTLTGGNLTQTAISSSSAQFTSLQVVGQANIAGQLFPVLGGSAGQALTSNGSGNLIWTTLGSTSTGLELPSLTSGQTVLGNASGVATGTSFTGALSLSNSGVVSVNNNAVGSAEIAEGSITGNKLSKDLTYAGNTSISHGLNVTGQANIGGVLYPVTLGTLGQTLKLGSNGNLVWADDSVFAANIINPSHIAEGAITAAKLANDAVEGGIVADGSLTGIDLSSAFALAGNLAVGGNLAVLGSANISGVIYPATLGSANQILIWSNNGQVLWGTLSTNILTADSITTAHLADSAVTTAKLALGAVTGAKLATGAVTADKIPADAITSAHLATDAVGNSELQDDISLANLTVTGNTTILGSVGVNGTLRGAGAGGNVWLAGNLVPTSGGNYQLGQGEQKWSAVYAMDLATSQVKSTYGEIRFDVNYDGVDEVTLNSTGLGVGKTPTQRLDVSGNIKLDGLLTESIQTVNASVTLGNTPIILVDTAAGNITLTLPAASAHPGESYTIKKIRRDNHYVRVVASDNIDGASNMFLKSTMGVLPSVRIISSGWTWYSTARSSTIGAKPSNSGSYMIVDVSGGPTATSYPVSYTSVTPDLTGAGNLAYKTGKIVLKWIEPGRFTMGNTTVGGASIPEHSVVLTEGFWAGVFEVTQQQWRNVMGSYPSGGQDYTNSGNTMPMHRVSWDDIRGLSATYNWPTTLTVGASTFMGNLLAKTGLPFDLPTEAEWEYSCRAGMMSEWSFGIATAGDYEWDSSNAGGVTHEVGGKLPNLWGLYDMHGNVYEWCRDWYATYPTSTEQSDPSGASSGTVRVPRGGGFSGTASDTRSSFRGAGNPSARDGNLGLRLFVRPTSLMLDLSSRENNFWTPAYMTTQAWYDAVDIGTIVLSSGNVSQWNDKSGNGLHMTSSNATARPSTGSEVINGHNVLVFDNDLLTTTSNPFSPTISNAAIFMVVNIKTMNTSSLFSLSGSDNAANKWASHCPWVDGTIYFDCGSSGPYRVSAASGFINNQVVLMGFYCSVTDNVQQVWADGTLKAGDATGHSVNTVSSMTLGGIGGVYDNCAIGECIIINGTVSQSSREKIEGYLAHKWGLTANLPGGHPYKSSPPRL